MLVWLSCVENGFASETVAHIVMRRSSVRVLNKVNMLVWLSW